MMTDMKRLLEELEELREENVRLTNKVAEFENKYVDEKRKRQLAELRLSAHKIAAEEVLAMH